MGESYELSKTKQARRLLHARRILRNDFVAPILALTLFLTIGSSPARAGGFRKDIKVVQAFRGREGDLIVRFETKDADFPAGNSVFWGKGSTLQQLELNWDDGESLLFYDSRFEGRSAELTIGPERSVLFCGKQETSYTALPETELRKIESSLQSGALRLVALPRVPEPLYLFRIKESQPPEYVFILTPRFDFHRQYDVQIGKPGSWKRIETVVRPKEEGNTEADLIHFKSGGGIHVPAAIALLSGADATGRADRGTPTLIRKSGAKMEELVRPDLKPAELKRLGFFSDERPLLSTKTPCDLISAETAQRVGRVE
jgi:hypothetical protein